MASKDALLRVLQDYNQGVSHTVFLLGAGVLYQAHMVVQDSVPVVLGSRTPDPRDSCLCVLAMLDTKVIAALISWLAREPLSFSLSHLLRSLI